MAESAAAVATALDFVPAAFNSTLLDDTGNGTSPGDDPYHPPPLKLTLVVSFVVIFLYVSFQVFLAIRRRYHFWSFQIGFYLLTALFAILRFAFWLHCAIRDNNMGPLETFLLLYAPLAVQFATYSLLMLFFFKVINRSAWHGIKKRARATYVVVNIVIALYLIAYGIVADQAVKSSPGMYRYPPSLLSSLTHHLLAIYALTIDIYVRALTQRNNNNNNNRSRGNQPSLRERVPDRHLDNVWHAFRDPIDHCVVLGTP